MLDEKSKYLRRLILRALRVRKGGHMGSAFSLIEIMRILYDIKQPQDKIILSKGHGALAQYVLLVDKGIIPESELEKFCKKDGILGGHPAPHIPGVHCHTGALGHGLSIGCGMALAAKIRKQGHRIFVIVGDGELGEGSIWEAAMFASKHKLDNLIVIVDRNGMQSSGKTETIQPLEPLRDKWRAFGWMPMEADGHHIGDLNYALTRGFPKPLCIIANTIKGRGISFAENDQAWHHKPISEDEFAKMEAELV